MEYSVLGCCLNTRRTLVYWMGVVKRCYSLTLVCVCILDCGSDFVTLSHLAKSLHTNG